MTIMDKPNLERIWETFIKFSVDEVQFAIHFDIIRNQIYPLVTKLKNDGIINWYCFLVHGKDSGVPTTPDDANLYYHIRFGLKEDIDLTSHLPNFCVMTRKIDASCVRNISVGQGLTYNIQLMKDESIEEVWRLIGEQSEWVINLLISFKDNINVPWQYVGQFLNYYSNMTQLRVG
jgi:hypothetical protein